MKPKAEHTITYHCLFCGHRWTEPDDIYDEDSTLDTSSCRKCLPTLRVGEQIRYGAAERSPADAVYADFKLKRGEVYTVKKVIRHQHAAYVQLEETGPNCTFMCGLFVPLDFVKPSPAKEN